MKKTILSSATLLCSILIFLISISCNQIPGNKEENKYFKINENNKDKIKLLVRKMQNILEQDNLGDKLLINCLENNKIIDVTLLLYFANTLLKENNINGNIEIKNGINAAATNSDWDFYFDYNRLLKPFANNYDYRKNKGYIDIINSTLLYTVTHEMSHSLDMKKALENNDYLIDLEYALLDTFEQINAKVYLE